MSGEEGGENKGLHCHELDEDVEGGARCVLEGITNGVTNDGRLVRVRAFRAKGPGVLRSSSLNKPKIKKFIVKTLL